MPSEDKPTVEERKKVRKTTSEKKGDFFASKPSSPQNKTADKPLLAFLIFWSFISAVVIVYG